MPSESALQVVPVPEFTQESSQYDTQYRRTMKWDFEKGDFVRNGAHRVVESGRYEGFMVWCVKTAMTERYACDAYPSDIGVEMEQAIAQDDQKLAESMVERTITDALKVNPRTEWVNDFQFTWDADELHCTFNVKGVEWDKVFQISI